MTAAGLFLFACVALWCIAALVEFAPRIKNYLVSRLAVSWWESGSPPWYLRLTWRLLAPFLRGA